MFQIINRSPTISTVFRIPWLCKKHSMIGREKSLFKWRERKKERKRERERKRDRKGLRPIFFASVFDKKRLLTRLAVL